MKKKIKNAGLGLFLLMSSGVNAAVIMDSVNEFSSIQGQDDWMYGYYDGDSSAYTPGDFEKMTQFNTDTWWVQEGTGGFWTSLNSLGGHPNGVVTSGGRQSINHWAVRRWVSDSSGVLSLMGNLSMENTFGINGVNGHIFVDGVEVFSENISASDGIGINYSFDVTISSGSIIDFAIDPFNSHDGGDSTTFTVVGNLSPSPVPAPAAIWLLSSGLIGLIGINKKSPKLSGKYA